MDNSKKIISLFKSGEEKNIETAFRLAVHREDFYDLIIETINTFDSHIKSDAFYLICSKYINMSDRHLFYNDNLFFIFKMKSSKYETKLKEITNDVLKIQNLTKKFEDFLKSISPDDLIKLSPIKHAEQDLF